MKIGFISKEVVFEQYTVMKGEPVYSLCRKDVT